MNTNSNIKSGSGKSNTTYNNNNVLSNCNICMTGLSTAELNKAINIVRELGNYCKYHCYLYL